MAINLILTGLNNYLKTTCATIIFLSFLYYSGYVRTNLKKYAQLSFILAKV